MGYLLFEEKENIDVESLDGNHKKLILILEQLLLIQCCDLNKEHITDVFIELEAYYKCYFVLEEKLLAEIHYHQLEAHKNSHLTFINEISQLKHEWLTGTYDVEFTKNKISLIIQQWLITHHIDKKLDYMPAVYSYQKFNRYKHQKTAKNPWLRLCSSRLSQYLSLSHRVFMTTLLPVVAVFLLCLVILKEYYKGYQSINMVLGLNNVIKEINIVSHSLQLERGLSAGTFNRKSTVFSEKLLNHRKSTDISITHFLWLLEQPGYKNIRKNMSKYLNNVKQKLAHISEYRDHLDSQLVDSNVTYQRYSELIESLLSVSEHLSHADVSSKHVNDILAINSILHYKEFMGQIRAIGLKVINNDEKNINDSPQVAFLFGQQNNTLSSFSNSANIIQKSICGISCNVQEQQKKIVHFYQGIMETNDTNAKMIEWFNTMSGEVNQLDIVLKGLIHEFDQAIYAEGQQLKINGFLIILSLSFFLFCTLFFSRVLNYSIISPIKKLTLALNGLSVGQNYIQFESNSRKDDISSMQVAFEKLRVKLLQGDIYKTTISKQKEELQYRKTQQDYFQQLASTDALTGAFNRHHFNAILQEEVTNFTLHGKALSIMVLDIDNFKKINDTYGHIVGDEMLILFYQTCINAVRSSDVVARIGGEEFVIIMPDTELNNATIFAERLRNKVANLDIDVENNKISMTVSIGVNQWDDNALDAGNFLEKTDKLLYQAKNSGRNKVVSAEKSKDHISH